LLCRVRLVKGEDDNASVFPLARRWLKATGSQLLGNRYATAWLSHGNRLATLGRACQSGGSRAWSERSVSCDGCADVRNREGPRSLSGGSVGPGVQPEVDRGSAASCGGRRRRPKEVRGCPRAVQTNETRRRALGTPPRPRAKWGAFDGRAGWAPRSAPCGLARSRCAQSR
jgi:hypothetical protein